MGRIVLAAACAAAAALGMVVVSSALAEIGSVRHLKQVFADRPVIANSKAGRFIVRGDHLLPGQKVRGQVRITNKGTRTGVLFVRPSRSLDTPGSRGRVLSSRLLLTIQRVRRDGTARTLWKGYLDGMGMVRIGVLRPGVARRYRFVVEFRVAPPARGVLAADLFQGSRFTTDLVWRMVVPE